MTRGVIGWSWIVVWIGIFTAAPRSGFAEVLYDKEGIQLQGSARIVSRNAAICNVLEEKYSPEEYEKVKANQGQAIHIWRLDYAAHNNTGKPLDYLTASFFVEAPHPPCTNWSGEGPGGGPSGDVTDDEGFRAHPLWGDLLLTLPKPSGLGVGEVERDTDFLLVFHADRPVFTKWNVNFTFARTKSRDPGAATPTGQRPPRKAATPRIQLPPDILADKYLRQAEQLVREKDPEGARKAMEELVALQQAHGLKAEPEDHFRYAQVWSAAGAPEQAMEAAVRYLQLKGRDAAHYEEALDLVNLAEARQARGEAGSGGNADAASGSVGVAEQVQSWFDPEQTCAGKSEGAECWMELTDQPSCYVWNDDPLVDQMVIWTGECSAGRAQGEGTLKWVEAGSDMTSESTGGFKEGKKHGQWVEGFAQGDIEEGPYVEGKRHGHWVTRYPDGTVWVEGPYVEGESHGHWVTRRSDGTVIAEGPYVEGKKHGHWVEPRERDTARAEGLYVDGKRHGRWVVRFADGTVEYQDYEDGKRVSTSSQRQSRSAAEDFSTCVNVLNCAREGTRVCVENRCSQPAFVRFCTQDVGGYYTPALCGSVSVRANDGFIHQGSVDHAAETYWRACPWDNAKGTKEQACYFELPR